EKHIFEDARIIFKKFRKKFLKDLILQQEFLDAIRKVLSLYDTKIYENRFIVGGVVEFIVLAAFKGLGFRGRHIGKESERFDIEIINDNKIVMYSVKSSFTMSDIRLINVLGKSESTRWEEPTIFILPHLGIGYADKNMVDKNFLSRQQDVIIIKRKLLEKFILSNKEFLIPLKEIPYKSEIYC
ncbi:MAG: hypothetical protein N2505_06680, partial [Endomicrobia bacterium]|nr:hypothetical protein [Endomicrobiia bacterium]